MDVNGWNWTESVKKAKENPEKSSDLPGLIDIFDVFE